MQGRIQLFEKGGSTQNKTVMVGGGERAPSETCGRGNFRNYSNEYSILSNQNSELLLNK